MKSQGDCEWGGGEAYSRECSLLEARYALIVGQTFVSPALAHSISWCVSEGTMAKAAEQRACPNETEKNVKLICKSLG